MTAATLRLVCVVNLLAMLWNGVVAQAQNPTRELVRGEWTRLWTIGGSEADTLLISPSRVLTAGAIVYVLDGRAPRLMAIDLATGRLLWSYGHRGRGPGEFEAPQSMARWPGGGIVVADAATGRMTVIDEHGQLSTDIRPRAPAVPFDICVLGDSSVLVVGARPNGMFSRFRFDGSIATAPDSPKSVLRDDGERTGYRARFGFVSSLNGDCYIALQRFGTLLRVGPEDVRYERSMIESFDWRDSTAKVADVDLPLPTPLAALGIWTDGEEVGVPFDGRTELRGRLIDLYRASDGEYLRTVVAPRPPVNRIVAAARSGRVYLFLHGINHLPALSAFMLEPTDDAP